MEIKKLIKYAQKPSLFERSEALFWDDPHISKYMLEAHINPNLEAASRRFNIIDASVKWLTEDILSHKNIKILDLGCGPGLYASRLAKAGYHVTGMDYSRRSIAYAKEYAKENNLDIDYIYQNYLTIDYNETFDAIFLIYCDLGALTNIERDLLLSKVYKALKPGGVFIFDVFTDKNRSKDEVGTSWEVTEEGFWKSKPYVALTETFLYEKDDTFLDQTIVMTDNGEINIHRIYDHFYTKPTITDVLDRFQFKNHDYYSDVTGKKYVDNSKTLAVVTHK